MEENKKLAILLHQSKCHLNHMDGCGWFYEIKEGKHDWDRFSHQNYLHWANEKIKSAEKDGLTADDLIKAYEITTKY
ncbi:MAG: hypothetical protein ACOC1K_00355 [Nanoarchaeota archaeon]